VTRRVVLTALVASLVVSSRGIQAQTLAATTFFRVSA